MWGYFTLNIFNSVLVWLAHGIIDLSVWEVIVLTLVLTHITIASVTIYLHRHQAHRALDLHPSIAHFFRLWLWMTTGMQTKEWAAIHRKHHPSWHSERFLQFLMKRHLKLWSWTDTRSWLALQSNFAKLLKSRLKISSSPARQVYWTRPNVGCTEILKKFLPPHLINWGRPAPYCPPLIRWFVCARNWDKFGSAPTVQESNLHMIYKLGAATQNPAVFKHSKSSQLL